MWSRRWSLIFFFSDMHAMLTRSALSDVVRYAKLTIDGCTQFVVRGACRISGTFAIFCKSFAQNLRDHDARLALYLASKRISTRKRAATECCSSCNHAGRNYAKFLRTLRAACRKFSETCNSFARVRRKIFVIPTLEA